MYPLTASLVPLIESHLDSFTATESAVANFFIHHATDGLDLSAEAVSERIHVSQSTLTRFAKKCGYSGYREFIYDYHTKLKQPPPSYRSEQMQRVLLDYNKILDKTYNLVDVGQIELMANQLTHANRVFLYGKGSSGVAATEMKLRFMRLGLPIEAITDDHVMKYNHILVDTSTIVVGLSVSGHTPIVLDALQQAHNKGAITYLFTSQQPSATPATIIPLASVTNLSYGNRISPQFPLLVVIDILYDYFMEHGHSRAQFSQTLEAFDLNESEPNHE